MVEKQTITEEQFAVLIKALRSAYAKDNFVSDDYSLTVWYQMLRDFSYDELSAGIQRCIQTCRFLPTIADIRNSVYALSRKNTDTNITEMSAWSMVRKAIERGIYDYETEYNKLPEIVQRAVGDATNIREWAQVPVDTVNSVIQSNFIRSFRSCVEHENDYGKLSPSMQRIIDRNMSDAMIELNERSIEASRQNEALIETSKEEYETVDVNSKMQMFKNRRQNTGE